ncbi:hypothetical protein NECAME_03433 [Necator americanus]|uniref:Insulin-like domain-containing protein n=1 Tax=Necator americanus TaxID=51031 RepID=W2T5M6_NECAM|nr:hypothetical protein NECAME_03433 [Necator americanus]ETN76501.1 hypothetical protein NECAME_03433 [Necator americanus]
MLAFSVDRLLLGSDLQPISCRVSPSNVSTRWQQFHNGLVYGVHNAKKAGCSTKTAISVYRRKVFTSYGEELHESQRHYRPGREQDEELGDFFAARTKRALIAPSIRQLQTICCDVGCSVNDLLSYCGPLSGW